jgi:hypothetical protein
MIIAAAATWFAADATTFPTILAAGRLLSCRISCASQPQRVTAYL